MEGVMHVEVIVRIDGQQVECLEQEITGRAPEIEETSHRLGKRMACTITGAGLNQLAEQAHRPSCCGRPMRHKGWKKRTFTGLDGEFIVRRTRYRCRECGCEQYAADAEIACGRHSVTRPLAKRVCQLATVEHYTQLDELLFDQHGVRLSRDEMMRIVHDVGTAADRWRRAEYEAWRESPRKIWPEPEFRPDRIYVSCDGIYYCTNQREPDPQRPDENRLLWQEMKVGCVAWQDEHGRWRKQVIWGRESPQDFGQALFLLACRCGYREAQEKIFAADGADWCWTIREQYFVDAEGILDWYHASEHVWKAARVLGRDPDAVKAWAERALEQLATGGGRGLVDWLRPQRSSLRGKRRTALNSLLAYIEPRQSLMDYPDYRARGWKIGTGLMESTVKQLVAVRLKGPGMHWSEQGAVALTALRAQRINSHWHQFWSNLVIAA